LFKGSLIRVFKQVKAVTNLKGRVKLLLYTEVKVELVMLPQMLPMLQRLLMLSQMQPMPLQVKQQPVQQQP
jgi:hypothetical protein